MFKRIKKISMTNENIESAIVVPYGTLLRCESLVPVWFGWTGAFLYITFEFVSVQLERTRKWNAQ